MSDPKFNQFMCDLHALKQTLGFESYIGEDPAIRKDRAAALDRQAKRICSETNGDFGWQNNTSPSRAER